MMNLDHPADSGGQVIPFRRPASAIHPDDFEQVFRPQLFAEVAEKVRKSGPYTRAEYAKLDAILREQRAFESAA